MNPAKSILNPQFRYRTAAQTDLRKTFARERKRLAEQERNKAVVTPLKRAK